MNKFPSKIYYTELIKSLMDEHCAYDSSLRCLINSNKFLNQILDLYKKFYYLVVSQEKLFEILNNSDIEHEDCLRLEEIFKVYFKYLAYLQKNEIELSPPNFNQNENIDNLIKFAKNLVQKTENFSCTEFEDNQNEIIEISEKIKKLISEGTEYCKIGILVQDENIEKNFIEKLKFLEIPTNKNLYDEKTINVRIKLEGLLNLFEITEAKGEQNIYTLQDENALLIIENLNYSPNIIEEFFELYKAQNYLEIIKKLEELEDIKNEELIIKIKNFINFSKNVLYKKPDKDALLKITDEILYNKKNNNQNCIKILSNPYTEEKFDFLFVPSLIENVFQEGEKVQFITADTNKKISEKIKALYPEFDLIIEENKTLNFEKIKQIFNLSEKNISFSTFSYAQTAKIAISQVFELFKYVSENNHISSNKKEENSKDFNFEIAEKKENSLYLQNEKLTLSASSIANFLTCPLKYYFKDILKLKELSSKEANYGTIIHSVFEYFNKHFLDNYTSEEMLKVSRELFGIKQTGKLDKFPDYIQDLILQTDDLALYQMEENFKNALENLKESGFFENAPESTESEKSFEFEIPEIPNVLFKGRIDLISKLKGKYSLVDFKTGKDKKHPQEYYVTEDALNYIKTTKNKERKYEESLEKEYEWQLPIYFLATEYTSEFAEYKGKINDFYLHFIRPTNAGGVKKDGVLYEQYLLIKNKLIENLKRTVVDKIRNTKIFEAQPDDFKCKYCPFDEICEKKETE